MGGSDRRIFNLGIVGFNKDSLTGKARLGGMLRVMGSSTSEEVIIISTPKGHGSSSRGIASLLVGLTSRIGGGRSRGGALGAVLGECRSVIRRLRVSPDIVRVVSRGCRRLVRTGFCGRLCTLSTCGTDNRGGDTVLITTFFGGRNVPTGCVGPGSTKLLIASGPKGTQMLPRSCGGLCTLQSSGRIVVFPKFFNCAGRNRLLAFSENKSSVSNTVITGKIGTDLCRGFASISTVCITGPGVIGRPGGVGRLACHRVHRLSCDKFSMFRSRTLRPTFDTKVPIIIGGAGGPSTPNADVAEAGPRGGRVISNVTDSAKFVDVCVNGCLVGHRIKFKHEILRVFRSFGLGFRRVPSNVSSLSVVLHTGRVAVRRRRRLLCHLGGRLRTSSIRMGNNVYLLVVINRNVIGSINAITGTYATLTRTSVGLRVVGRNSSRIDVVFKVSRGSRTETIGILCSTFFPRGS